MDIYEANDRLLRIGNAIIINGVGCYDVAPRTTTYERNYCNVRFYNLDDAYDYAITLPSNWNYGKEDEENKDMTFKADCEFNREMLRRIYGLNTTIQPKDFKNVYFNAEKGTTVIKWSDNTITKVKVQTEKGDTYNPELGMAMCIAKKALGNKGNFNEVFKKFLPKED